MTRAMTVTCRHCGEVLAFPALLEPKTAEFAPALVDHLRAAHPFLRDDLGHAAVIIGICFILSQFVARENEDFQTVVASFRTELTKLLEDLDHVAVHASLQNP